MHPSAWLARLVVDELVRGGVTDAVLCPGSRNAPLAFALHAADVAGRLRLHVRIDERTAGFLALGLALASQRPVPVCTTSGTAVANLHPAVLEASHAGVPLLALTADRPPELVGTGASQTIAQVGIFGAAVRAAPSVGGTTAQVRAAVARAVAAATGNPPGPAHLNIPFAEPLVPGPPDGTEGAVGVGSPGPGGAGGADRPPGDGVGSVDAGPRDGTGAVAGRRAGPWTAVAAAPLVAPPLPLDPTADTLVIAGPGAPVLDPAVPVVAEPSSAAWPDSVAAGPWLLDTPGLKPAQVVVSGRPTLHRAVSRLLADPEVAVYVAADPRGRPWTDVAGTVRAVGSLPRLRARPDWARRWARASAVAASALATAVPDAPVGLRLARALVAALPAGAQLVVGSSNAIRDVALAATPRAGVVVHANRGVAGIDGTVSTAIGAALTHPGPSFALLGDLTFLHDATGLMIGPDEPRPDLAIVVLNDHGGGIFTLLEQGLPEYAAAFERVFGTPHTVDLAGLCAANGVPHTRTTVDGITEALDGTGLRVVEVAADRAALRAGHAALAAHIAAALSAAL